MRTEIGSEFWSVPTGKENHLFSAETKWFLSGRSALCAILKENKFQTALLPDWCCDSMIKPFLDCGMKVAFYPALSGFSGMDADVALVMDYFGYTKTSPVGAFRGAIIRDVTHSILSEISYEDADYYFGSYRKWAAFYTGGFAWGFKKPVSYENENEHYVSLRKEAMERKNAYIMGETDDKGYLSLFSKAEELLEETGVFPADARDVELAKAFDVLSVRKQRRKNAEILLDAFSDIAVFPALKEEDCPLFVPVCVPNRDALRKRLIEHEIYCPVHWPVSSYHQISEKTQALYQNGLSLVCDQRYTEADMHRMVKVIRKFLKEGA